MIEAGSTVKILYTLTVDGRVVSHSEPDAPLTYVQGEGQIIPGLEEELQSLGSGDKATVTVSPERGYGVYDPQAVREFPKAAFQNPETLSQGDMISAKSNQDSFTARVAEIRPNDILLDLNHPLAGKTLNFEVEIVEVL